MDPVDIPTHEFTARFPELVDEYDQLEPERRSLSGNFDGKQTAMGLALWPNEEEIPAAVAKASAGPSDGRTASRVPSDHGSAAYGSEHSRVFSDSDDADGRSDTVYDSLRSTEATNSSHSGAKAQHVENLFSSGGLPPPSDANRSARSSRHGMSHHSIAEEEDSASTPVPNSSFSHPTDPAKPASPPPWPFSDRQIPGDSDDNASSSRSPPPVKTSKRKISPLQKVANNDPNFPTGSNVDESVPDTAEGLSPPDRARIRGPPHSDSMGYINMNNHKQPKPIVENELQRRVARMKERWAEEDRLDHESTPESFGPHVGGSSAASPLKGATSPIPKNYIGTTRQLTEEHFDDRFTFWREDEWEYVALDKNILPDNDSRCFIVGGPGVGQDAFQAVLNFVHSGTRPPTLIPVPLQGPGWASPRAGRNSGYPAPQKAPRQTMQESFDKTAIASQPIESLNGLPDASSLVSEESDCGSEDDEMGLGSGRSLKERRTKAESKGAWPLQPIESNTDPTVFATYGADLETERAFNQRRPAEDEQAREAENRERPSREEKRPSKPNIFEWSEPRQASGEAGTGGENPRPQTAHVQAAVTDRSGRSNSRRSAAGAHLRSQSVPLAPEAPSRLSGAAAKLDAWVLGGKGVSEDWDNDFDFDDENPDAHGSSGNGGSNGSNSSTDAPRLSAAAKGKQPTTPQHRSMYPPVVVPHAILEKQASVHGQFGQVKELTVLVDELRRLRHQAQAFDILAGQASELWKEAEGIIDLATLDEDEPLQPPLPGQQSPAAASIDFDAFDDDAATIASYATAASPASVSLHRRRSSTVRRDESPYLDPTRSSSHLGSGTPSSGRPRQESIAKAKHVLENISKNRAGSDPVLAAVQQAVSSSPTKKLPFDTTSLRDLVTRAGVVTRALKEVIRRAEDPDYVPSTPERRGGDGSSGGSTRDPPFSQIFRRMDERTVKMTTGDDDVLTDDDFAEDDLDDEFHDSSTDTF